MFEAMILVVVLYPGIEVREMYENNLSCRKALTKVSERFSIFEEKTAECISVEMFKDTKK